MARRIAVAAVLFGCLPALGAASEPRSHDGGFFARLSAGLAVPRTEFDDGFERIEFDGVGGDFNFAIGGIVSRNLAVHLTLFGWGVPDPDVTIHGEEFETDDTELSLGAVGGGVTYYLAESNVYLTASAGLARLNLSVDGEDEDSDTGIALDLGIGKEWWLSDAFGLGVAAGLNWHSVPPGGDADDNLSGVGFSIRLSATFN